MHIVRQLLINLFFSSLLSDAVHPSGEDIYSQPLPQQRFPPYFHARPNRQPPPFNRISSGGQRVTFDSATSTEDGELTRSGRVRGRFIQLFGRPRRIRCSNWGQSNSNVGRVAISVPGAVVSGSARAPSWRMGGNTFAFSLFRVDGRA